MRHNQNRRSRGRNRKGPNPLARSYESTGPDVKVRGTAMHVAEKYMSLARDAHAAGDTVAAENYLQHAEHYNRIVMAAQQQQQQNQPVPQRDYDDEGDDDDRFMNGRGRDRFYSDSDENRAADEREERAEANLRPASERSERAEAGAAEAGFGDGGRRPPRRGAAESYGEERAGGGEDRPAAEPMAPRRRRPRGPRPVEEAVGSDESDGNTPDGAAALAAFPD